MKVQYASDLHLDTNKLTTRRQFARVLRPQADYLVLAGDIVTYWNPKLLYRFLVWCRQQFRRVALVPGNHEFALPGTMTTASVYHSLQRALRTLCKLARVDFLDQSVVMWDGVPVVGCTLWSDLSHCTDISSIQHKICIPVELYTDLHRRNVIFLLRSILMYSDRPMIIVTHYGPVRGPTTDARYADDPLQCLYTSNLDMLVKTVRRRSLWISGHAHHNFRFQMSRCRLVSNCLGYLDSEHSSTGLLFQADACVSL